MSVEYGLLTGDLEEKKILKVLNDKLKHFFVEMTSEQYNLYKTGIYFRSISRIQISPINRRINVYCRILLRKNFECK